MAKEHEHVSFRDSGMSKHSVSLTRSSETRKVYNAMNFTNRDIISSILSSSLSHPEWQVNMTAKVQETVICGGVLSG